MAGLVTKRFMVKKNFPKMAAVYDGTAKMVQCTKNP
jgi:hypothetical protein